MTKTDTEFAEYLAEEGQSFSDELYNDFHDYFEDLPYSYFSIAAAVALCWSKHAKYNDEFVEYAAGFIDGVLPKNPDIANTYFHRFGPEKLDSVLTNYRKYYRRVRDIMPDFTTCSMHEINKLQQRTLNLLNQYRNSGEITHIGPWLFLGPFKIILGNESRFWNDEAIDSIVLATGIEVNRGITRMIEEGYSFMSDFDIHWLEEETGSFLESYATCNMVHTYVVKIARLSDTCALHINSGLFQYGKQKI